jgi:deazaflavin-dependent oxidoreductase (nitroreductase family)
LLLTTQGRRSRKRRTTPLVYLRDGQNLVVIASYGGRDDHPGWFWNLESNHQAQVRIDGRSIAVVTRKASNKERARLWPLVLLLWPGYARYQERTRRTIPLVILSPNSETNPLR